MKRMKPNLRQPIESGDLLYDLVLAQQADEEELKNTLYQNQTLEDFSGGRMEFQNCIFRGCQFVRCRLDNFSFTDVLLENCNLSGSTLRDLATQRGDSARLQADGLQSEPVAFAEHRLF